MCIPLKWGLTIVKGRKAKERGLQQKELPGFVGRRDLLSVPFFCEIICKICVNEVVAWLPAEGTRGVGGSSAGNCLLPPTIPGEPEPHVRVPWLPLQAIFIPRRIYYIYFILYFIFLFIFFIIFSLSDNPEGARAP